MEKEENPMSEDCGFCDREIVSTLTESEYTPSVVLDRIEGEVDELLVRGACGNCATEILELTDDMTLAEGLRHPYFDEGNLEDFDACSLCDGSLGSVRGVFSHGPYRGSRDHEYILCERCIEVIHQFLQNVPEGTYTADKYTGPPEIGWLGHYWVLNKSEAETRRRRRERVEKLLQAVRNGDSEVYEQLFGEFAKTVRENANHDGKVWMDAHVNPQGVIMPYANYYLTEPREMLIPSEEPRDVQLGVPADENTSATSIAESVDEDIEESIESLGWIIEECEDLMRELESDMRERQPAAWETLKQSTAFDTA